MPSPDFSMDITSIFGNSQLKQRLKYDIVCRFVCETLQASSVSMLMYRAESDNLYCRGSYLARENRSNFKGKENDFLRTIINHIALFEFFDSQLYESDFEELELRDFEDSIVCGKTCKNKIDDNLFVELKDRWKDPSVKSIYESYKKTSHREEYEIDSKSISGNFFSRLLKNKDNLVNDIELMPFKEGPQKGKPFFDVWEAGQIQIPSDDLYYIGLPLFATERYTGILRITCYSASDTVLNEIISIEKDQLSVSPLYERLNNFVHLISLHLKINYYLAGYREFSNIKLDIDNNLRINNNELISVCNTLSKVINCNGCIIRFSEREETDDPPIKATSTTLKEYYAYTKGKESSKFSEDIYRILKEDRHNGYYIKAINFSVNEIEKDTFNTKEYYYDSNIYLRSKEVLNRQFKDFTPSYIRKLIELKMREIIVLPIDEVREGIIILTNTQNRFFTSSDIEMILLASKNIKLEIKHLQQLEQQKQSELQKAQISGMNIVLHQFGQIIKSSTDTSEEIKDRTATFIKKFYGDEKNAPEEFVKILQNIRLLGFLVTHSQNQILRANRINEVDVKPIQTKIKPIYDFGKFLRNKCKDFEPYANVEREIHIWLLNSDREIERIDTDEELLTEVIYNLLDNAIKYSHEASEMKSKGVSFDPLSYRSDGNILIKYKADYSKLEIDITNWGNIIRQNERTRIFERSWRGSNSSQVVGTGIGLYLSKKIIDALNGSISVEGSTNHKTTFRITLNK